MVLVGGNEPEQEIRAMAVQKEIKANSKGWIQGANVDAPGNDLSRMAQANA